MASVAVAPAFLDSLAGVRLRFGHSIQIDDLGEPRARIPALRREPVATVQLLLARLGYDPGAVDGVTRAKTREAARNFRRSRGIAGDGDISVGLVGQLFQALP